MKSQAIASFDDKTQPGGFLSRKMSDTKNIYCFRVETNTFQENITV